ncbi:MAG: hypothetical protein E7E21_13410, partial [Peptostreptococcaceae bacterium]|nr:hypothetical protein [Peptostreptococcaceae bacterium]
MIIPNITSNILIQIITSNFLGTNKSNVSLFIITLFLGSNKGFILYSLKDLKLNMAVLKVLYDGV